MRRWLVLIAVASVVIVVGLSRLELDADVFGLLPRDEPTVQGLKLYHETFGSAQELMLTLRSPDAELTENAARALAEALEVSDLTDQALWRDPFRDDPEALAELLAYLWLNQPEEEFARMAERFDDGRLEPVLDETIELMTTSLRAEDVGRLSHDPYGLTYLPGNIESPISRGLEDPFSSADGRFRILFVSFPYEDAGYFTSHRWTTAIEQLIADWRLEEGFGDEVVIKMTGDPAFIAEVGAGLMRDMKLAALGTLILVASLFWFVHRSWLPLTWLVVLLVVVLTGTVAIGTLLLGPLNVVALGFAAILLGLAADYALILYQEYISDRDLSVPELRRIVAPSILWAACTTAGAFFMVGRSSLPGLTQLGTLVAVGIVLAAAVMLLAFLTPLASVASDRRKSGPQPAVLTSLSGRTAWIITVLAIAASGLVLARQLPQVDTSTDDLGPKNAAARQALDEVHVEVGGFAEALWLLVEGADEGEVSRRLQHADQLLDAAVEDGRLTGSALPTALWPRPPMQGANRPLARALGSRLEPARKAALSAGFTEESLRLTVGIFDAWREFAAADGVVMPQRPASEWAFRKFSARDGDRLLVVGRVDRRMSVPVAELEKLAAAVETDGSQLLGWPFISGALLETMRRDLSRVLVPMMAVILLLLGFAFRGLREVLLSLATLAFSLLCLSSVMVLLGWAWNLMNVMALPLLFGAAVDYGIHIQLALQRHDGHLRRVRETVGRAILLCGASTAAGFGTLGFASNGGLATLGKICATGIVIAALASVFLLPVWWRAARGR
jgi:predicted RND superfamily exporter protein